MQGQSWVQKWKVTVWMRSLCHDLIPGQARGGNMVWMSGEEHGAPPINFFYLFFLLSRLQKKTKNMGKGEAIKHSHNKVSHFTLLSAPLLQLFFLNFGGPNTPETRIKLMILPLAKHYQIYCFRYGKLSLLYTLKQFCLPGFIFTSPY